MNKIWSLVRRNMRLYFSNKSNIFFSMLAMIILVSLHFIVFRKMNSDNLLSLGLPVEEKWSLWFSDCLMLSALIPVGATTISLTSISQLVIDKERKTINDFYITPINKNILLCSYLFSSFAIGAMVLIGLIVFIEIYLLVIYGISFTLTQIILILGVAGLSLILANSFILLLISFIKREQAVGAVGSIVGTLIGFVCGAYIPVGVLGDTIAKIFISIPFLPLTAISRQIFFMNVSSTGLTEEMLGGELAKKYGYELFFGDTQLSNSTLILMIVGYIVLFSILLIMRFKKMRNDD